MPTNRKIKIARNAKPATKAASKPAKQAAKPAAKPEAAKPDIHGLTSGYRGASPVFRGHGRKLTPIVLDRVPGRFTDRDLAFLRALYGAHKTGAFRRLDADAGNLSRAIGHGYIAHVSGALDQRDATFRITDKAVRERFAKA